MTLLTEDLLLLPTAESEDFPFDRLDLNFPFTVKEVTLLFMCYMSFLMILEWGWRYSGKEDSRMTPRLSQLNI